MKDNYVDGGKLANIDRKNWLIIFCVIFQVAKDFGFDDISVIERLRENMHYLSSHLTIFLTIF